MYRITKDAWNWYQSGEVPPGDIFSKYGLVWIEKLKKTLPVFCSILLLQPEFAYASGDPAVLFWFGGLTILHLILFVFLFVKGRNLINKVIKLSVYTFIMLLLWKWGMSVEGPNFTSVYMVLSICPIAITILLLRI